MESFHERVCRSWSDIGQLRLEPGTTGPGEPGTLSPVYILVLVSLDPNLPEALVWICNLQRRSSTPPPLLLLPAAVHQDMEATGGNTVVNLC